MTDERMKSSWNAELVRQHLSKASFSAAGDRFTALESLKAVDQDVLHLKEINQEAMRILDALFSTDDLELESELSQQYAKLKANIRNHAS